MNTENFITFGKRRYHQHPEMEAWCAEKIGKGGWRYRLDQEWTTDLWGVKSMFGHTTFSFKEPKHLTMFLLVWA